MADKSPEALIREKVVSAGGGGRVTDTGDTGVPPTTEGRPSEAELEHMLTQMRRHRRRVRAMDEQDLSAASTERGKDDIRYRMLWGDVRHRRDVDRLSGSASGKTRAAESAMKEHVDMMNKLYGIGIDYPETLEVGDPIIGEAVPLHEIPTGRTRQKVLGAREATPEDVEEF